MNTTDSVILTGSFARGMHTPKSDIDLIFISERVTYFHTETIWEQGVELQIIQIPRTKIYKMIMESSFENNGLLVSMLKSCIIISDQSGYANKLSNYVENMPETPGEQAILLYVSTLSKRCSDLKNSDDELEQALLASTIMILLAHLLTYSFISGTKHCMRILSKSHRREEVLYVYRQYAEEKNYTKLLNFTEETIANFKKEILTTGKSLNNYKSDDSIIVFFPHKSIFDPGMRKILVKISCLCSDCNIHTFYQNPFQALKEGTYVYIQGKDITAKEICRRLRSYDISIAKSRTALGIELIFPYYTTFETGVYFGGYDIFNALSPVFSMLWNEYCLFGANTNDKVKEYSIASGLLLLSKIISLYSSKFEAPDTLLTILIEILLPDVVDPNGHYNVEQTGYLRSVVINSFLEQYAVTHDHFEQNMKDILENQIKELNGISLVIDILIDKMNSVDETMLSYPDLYPLNKKTDMFFMEMCLHCLSILQMTQEQKFGIIFNIAILNEVCLEPFLSQDK